MSARIVDKSPFEGSILVCAPHMDDETLGCGMLIALHAARASVHVLFATDGAGSPQPPADRPDTSLALPAVRQKEAIEALEVLGVPRPNIEFLDLPDGALQRHEARLERFVLERARRLRASTVLVPFRYDRHPDHLALNRAITRARCDGRLGAEVVEYFVYTKWRLLGSGDVRDYLVAQDTIRLRSDATANRKRAALSHYRSQTTLYFDGQRRPILTETLLEQACTEAETFLRHRRDRNGSRGLARRRYWIPFACRVEPVLKRWKDYLAGVRVQ
jgi:LmbE family N-acetylglucosaminyl deacetylase